MNDLANKKCVSCEKGAAKLNLESILSTLEALSGWELTESEPKAISRLFHFGNFHETMAFVNAVAWIAHCEDHHPDMEVGYKTCKLTWSTHSVGGLTENDFICAAKASRLLPAADAKP